MIFQKLDLNVGVCMMMTEMLTRTDGRLGSNHLTLLFMKGSDIEQSSTHLCQYYARRCGDGCFGAEDAATHRAECPSAGGECGALCVRPAALSSDGGRGCRLFVGFPYILHQRHGRVHVVQGNFCEIAVVIVDSGKTFA